jgi:hypothetical protein
LELWNRGTDPSVNSHGFHSPFWPIFEKHTHIWNDYLICMYIYIIWDGVISRWRMLLLPFRFGFEQQLVHAPGILGHADG